jgi:acetyl esterase/lipase
MKRFVRSRFVALGFIGLIGPWSTTAAWAVEEKAKPEAKAAKETPTNAKSAKPSAGRMKPTEADVSYGKHPKQVVDFYRADSQEPAPLLFYIHGGGWSGGSKNISAEPYVRAGIAVVAVEYRFVAEASADGVVPPVKGPLGDAARALQFVRSKAKEWNIDTTRIGASGASAGACSSLWLAFHDDMADPQSDDPVARQSTRLSFAAVGGAQTSLDPKQLKEWTPNSFYGGHAFFTREQTAAAGKKPFDYFLEQREKILPWIKEYSPIELVTADDPPVALFYNEPPAMGQEAKDPTHTANYGVALKEKCDSVGVKCRLFYPGGPDTEFANLHPYLLAKLGRKAAGEK